MQKTLKAQLEQFLEVSHDVDAKITDLRSIIHSREQSEVSKELQEEWLCHPVDAEDLVQAARDLESEMLMRD